MPLSSWELQEALFSILDGGLSISVYDHVPQDSAYPFVVIGNDNVIPWDTKNKDGQEFIITIDTFDAGAGRKDTKELLVNIYDLLHHQESSFTLAGFNVILSRFQSENTLYETNVVGGDKYVHGIQTYRILIQQG